MKMSLCTFALLAVAGAANAQVSYTGGTFSENFDQLVTVTPSPSPFSATIGQQFAIPGMTNPWAVAKTAGTGTTAMPYTADVGTGNSGGIFSYGAAGNGERALGSLASGSNVPAFGVMITNNTGATLTSFTLDFDSEQYRSSTSTTNVLLFAWGTSSGPATDSTFLTAAGLAAAAAADIQGDPFVAANGQVNPPSVKHYNTTINFNLAPGERLYLRWTDTNDIGNDAGLSIDNFNFSAIPTPGAAALMGIAGLAGLRRRRA